MPEKVFAVTGRPDGRVTLHFWSGHHVGLVIRGANVYAYRLAGQLVTIDEDYIWCNRKPVACFIVPGVAVLNPLAVKEAVLEPSDVESQRLYSPAKKAA